MIFRTIQSTDENGIVNTRVITALNARKIAQEELNATLTKEAAQLEFDVTCLKNYEIECAKCGDATKAFGSTMTNASAEAQAYAVQTRGAAGSSQAFSDKQKAAQQALKGTANASKTATIATKALSIALNMGLMLAIQLVITGLNKLVHAKQEASEKAKELAETSKQEASEMQQEVSTLNELIKKYKELANSEQNSETRSEIRDIQSQITELVGTQADNLDLVNGRLDTELDKLKQISIEEAKRAKDKASESYYYAKDAANRAVGQDKFLFWNDYDYKGKISKQEKTLLNDVFSNIPEFNYAFGYGSFQLDSSLSIKDKISLLEEMLSSLEKMEGYTQSDLYIGLQKSVSYYKKFVDDVDDSYKTLIDSSVTYYALQKKNTVHSIDSLEDYRKELTELILSDKDVKDHLLSGDISESDIQQSVISYISTLDDFSDYYEGWVEKYNKLSKEAVDSLRESILNISDNITNGDLRARTYQLLTEYTKDFGDAQVTAWRKVTDGTTSASEALEKWLEYLRGSVSTFTPFSYVNEKEVYENLSNALASSTSKTGLLPEDVATIKDLYADLDGYDYSKLFDNTANGIHLNFKELQKLNSEYVKQKKLDIVSELREEKKNYSELKKGLKDLSDADRETRLQQLEDSKELIRSLEEEYSRYEALTSAYSTWQQAIDTENEGAMADSITNWIETAKEFAEDNRFGNDDMRSYVAMLTGNMDLLTSSVSEVEEAWNNLNKKTLGDTKYTMMDLFEEGSDGALNFLEVVHSINKEWAWVDENGNWQFDFDDEKLAKSLGTSVEIVDIFLRKLSEFMDVDIDDQIDKSIESLEKELEKAEKRDNAKYTVEINTDVAGLEDINSELEHGKDLIEKMQSTGINTDVDTTKLALAESYMDELIAKKVQLSIPKSLQIKPEGLDETSSKVFDLAQEYAKLTAEVEARKEVGLDTEHAQEALKAAQEKAASLEEELSKLSVAQLQAIGVKVDINSSKEEITKAIREAVKAGTLAFDKNEINITVTSNAEEVKEEELSPLKKFIDGLKKLVSDAIKIDFEDNALITKSNIEKLANAINGIPKDVKVNVSTVETTTKINVKKTSKKSTGNSDVNGTFGNAYVKGTKGKIHSHKSGKALGGEEGQELWVHGDTFETIGDNGAEFFDYHDGDIIFDAEQTKRLLQNGHINSRGIAFLHGNAFSSGGGLSSTRSAASKKKAAEKSSSSSSNSNSSNTSDNVASEETKQEIDWIERLLSKLQYRIDVTKSKLESLFSVKAKNANIDKQIKQTTSLLHAQTKAAESYQKYADAVNLSADLKKLVDSGNYNISEYSQDTADLINQYKDLRDKAKDARKAVYDLRAEIISLSQEKIDNITDSFSDKRDSYSARTDYLDERFDYETSNKKKSSILTAKAKLANKTYKTYKDEYITALKERKSDAKAAKRLIGQSALSDKIKNTINSYIKNGKAIPDKYLNAVANAGDVSAYIKLVEYNQDLKWVDTTKYEAKKAKYETLNEIADSSQQKIDIVSESYSSKRDTYSSQSDYLDSKYNYETFNKKKSTILKEKTKNARKVYKTYKDEYSTALKERNADAKSAKKLLKKSGVSDKIKNAINSYIKKKKAIPQKYLTAVYNAGDIDTYTKLLEYNQDLDWVDTAKTEAKQAKYDYLTEKRENTAEKYENYANTYGAKSDYYKLLEDNATTGKQKNKYEKQSLNQTKKEYDMLIKAAKARGDNIEALRLEAELEQKINDSYKTMFDNMQKAYENKISLITNKLSDVDNEVKKVEAQGKRIDASFYGKKIKLEKQTLEKLQQEEASLTKQVENIEKYSDEWYECQSAIQSVQDAEADALATIKEYRDAINEIADTINSDILSAFEEIEDEAELLIKLLGDDLSNDDTGMLTEDGLAALTLYKAQMDSSTESAKGLLSLIQSINSAIDNGSYGSFLDSNGIRRQYASIDEAKDAVTELYQTYRDEISKTYEYESDIIELVKKKYEAELNYLKDLIDKKKESLDAEKDLYDYAKNIRQQTENIDSLRKQINALRGDTSKEGQARIQKLESQLKDAQEELRDTEYDRYISDQKDMLDNFYNEYAELVAKLEKNREQLLKEGLDLFSATSADVQDLIRETAESYGYQMTAQMSDISSALGTNSPIYSILTEIRDEVKNRYVNLSSASSTVSETTTAQTNASSTSTTSSSTSAIESLLRSGTHGYNPKNASALNTYIHDKYGTALSPAQMVTLAGYLGLNYSANDITSNSKDSASNKKKNEILKKLKAQGFSKGGVIKADDSLADVLGVRSSDAKDKVILKGEAGERVLTKLQNDYWEKWTNALPDLVNAMPTLQDIAKIPDTTSVQNNNSMTKVEYGEVNINLPNVMNYQDFAREAQKDPKFNKMINSMVDNQLTGSGRLRKFNVRF